MELTVYWARVPADKLELCIDVLFDIVSDSQLAASDIDRERMVILEELKMYQDQPQDYVHSLFEHVMWPGHPLGRDIIGTAESVSGTSREDLVSYIQSHYTPDRLVVGLSGGIDTASAAQLMDQRLQLTGRPDGSVYQPVPEALTAANVLLHRKDTEQAHVCLGSRAVSYPGSRPLHPGPHQHRARRGHELPALPGDQGEARARLRRAQLYLQAQRWRLLRGLHGGRSR